VCGVWCGVWLSACCRPRVNALDGGANSTRSQGGMLLVVALVIVPVGSEFQVVSIVHCLIA
jgi:hypothetical protein